MNNCGLVFIAALSLSFIVEIWLVTRQIRHVSAHRQHVPTAFADSISLQDHQKAADYTLSKVQFGLLEGGYGLLLILLWTFGGGLNWLDQSWLGLGLGPILSGAWVIGSVMLVSELLSLP